MYDNAGLDRVMGFDRRAVERAPWMNEWTAIERFCRVLQCRRDRFSLGRVFDRELVGGNGEFFKGAVFVIFLLDHLIREIP